MANYCFCSRSSNSSRAGSVAVSAAAASAFRFFRFPFNKGCNILSVPRWFIKTGGRLDQSDNTKGDYTKDKCCRTEEGVCHLFPNQNKCEENMLETECQTCADNNAPRGCPEMITHIQGFVRLVGAVACPGTLIAMGTKQNFQECADECSLQSTCRGITVLAGGQCKITRQSCCPNLQLVQTAGAVSYFKKGTCDGLREQGTLMVRRRKIYDRQLFPDPNFKVLVIQDHNYDHGHDNDDDGHGHGDGHLYGRGHSPCQSWSRSSSWLLRLHFVFKTMH